MPPPAQTKRARLEEWVRRYLQDHEQVYDDLVAHVGVDRLAQRHFRELFGPTTLARLFTSADGADGDGKQERSNKTAIQQLNIYRARIQPVLQGKPPRTEREMRRQHAADHLQKAGL